MSPTWKSICCVIGAILINLTLGTFYSIGNLLPYMASYMRGHGNPDVTTEHGTWITATFLLGQAIFIIVGSYIEQNFNSRVACLFGCIIHCISTFMTIWALNVSITAVILVYGFGSGLGCGSAYMASIIAAQKWFPARKGIFTGLIVAGFGFGGLIFTNLQTLYINPNNIASENSGYFSSEVYDRVPSMFMYMGIIFTIAQSLGCALAFPPPNSGTITNDHAPSINLANGPTTIYNDDALPVMRTTMSSFNYRIFYVIGLMMMMVAPGVILVNSLGKRFGQTHIGDDRYLATVVAVAAVANAFGRLTWGYLADKFTFGTCFTLKVLLFTSLIILFPFDFVLSSRVHYLIWMLGLFFGFSGTFVLFPVFIEQVFGAKYHGIVYGILYLFLAMSSILTSFLIQLTIGSALADQSISANQKFYIRLWPCVIIAASYALSLAIFFLCLPIKRIDNAIRRRKESEVARTRSGLFNRPDLLVQDRGAVLHENSQVERENSLGSIVKYTDTPNDPNGGIRTLGNRNIWAR